MARSRPSPWNGLLLIDKEPGWTSHDVVARSRSLLGTRKVGHAGTLDPPATGLLLVGAGTMTRLLRYLTALPKTYVGEVVFGQETDTLDDTGAVTAVHEMREVTLDRVRDAARGLTGEILQVPPMVSALKVGGRRLHELARAGQEVERAPRPVTVYEFGVEPEVEPGVFPIRVGVSAGTYVRTLAADLGTALGGGAHLRNLRRVSAGSFRVEDARPLSEVVPERDVLAPAAALADLARVGVEGDVRVAVGHGRPLPRDELGIGPDDEGPWAVLDAEGVLLAVYGPHRVGLVKPEVVVAGISDA